ncbi:hypothetical protein LSH36_61g09069 [Paralvinella palmiformis]|uniref:Uncharacterized protein n=1 Tax=Paralvinella palmiformis TaxID=53620 RepID=A0AAD9K4I6_9ANNE|nr:hypothetical protein LSH36_61g09069 [Paralvinella palmiformis]
MGKHGIGKCNSNGELLLVLCSEYELIVTNTMFKQKDERKTNWMHTRSRHWHMIEFIITRRRDKMDIHSTRAMRGANCWTDHKMLRSKVAFRIRQKDNRQETTYKDNCTLLQKRTRTLRSDWWEIKAVELQIAADKNNMKSFYIGPKEIWGPKEKGPVHLKSTDGIETFSNSKRVVTRWSEYFLSSA